MSGLFLYMSIVNVLNLFKHFLKRLKIYLSSTVRVMVYFLLQDPVDKWPLCDCLIAFHSKGFPLEKTIQVLINS